MCVRDVRDVVRDVRDVRDIRDVVRLLLVTMRQLVIFNTMRHYSHEA